MLPIYDNARPISAARIRRWQWCDECHQSGGHARGCPNAPPEPEEHDEIPEPAPRRTDVKVTR